MVGCWGYGRLNGNEHHPLSTPHVKGSHHRTVAVPNLLFFAAVPRVGAGFLALAITFPPLLTYLGALLLGIERFRAIRGAGVVLALGGAAVLAFFKLSVPNADTFWIIATLSGPVVLAAGNIYRTARWPPGELPDALAPGMLAASGLILLSVGLVAWLLPGTSGGFTLAIPTFSTVPALLIIAQTATFSLQYLLFFVLQKTGDLST